MSKQAFTTVFRTPENRLTCPLEFMHHLPVSPQLAWLALAFCTESSENDHLKSCYAAILISPENGMVMRSR